VWWVSIVICGCVGAHAVGLARKADAWAVTGSYDFFYNVLGATEFSLGLIGLIQTNIVLPPI
jgi:hypothetical protein